MDRGKSYIKQFYKNNHINLIVSLLGYIVLTVYNIGTAFIFQWFIDAAKYGQIKDLKTALVRYLICLGIVTVQIFIMRIVLNNFKAKAMRQYKDYAFENLLKKNMTSFNKNITGKYISIFTNDLKAIESGYVAANFEIIIFGSMLVAAVIAMLYLNITMAVISITMGIISIVVSSVLGKSQGVKERKLSDDNEEFVDKVRDIFSGISMVKSYMMESEISSQFDKINKKLEGSRKDRNRNNELIKIVNDEILEVSQVIIFALGAYFVISGYIKLGSIMAIIQLSNFISMPIGQLVAVIPKRRAAKELIVKMEEATACTDNEMNKVMKDSIDSEIRFENVTFAYEEGKDILKNINVNFEKGKSYALVGASGCGKSTLLSLILGYTDNYSGNIYVDGVELRNIKSEGLYSIFSTIQQNVFIFNDTIQNNITMFKEQKKDNFNNALDMSRLNEVLEDKGADYNCGEGGNLLSGGQKQRISIARALIKKSPVLIMDEGTSALDADTARKVENNISKINELTRIAITHKLDEDILSLYDEIIVLNQGRICETGSFNELINKKGYFYSLYSITNIADSNGNSKVS